MREMRNPYKILVGKHEGNRPIVEPTHIHAGGKYSNGS
jgi:hypothetical protein